MKTLHTCKSATWNSTIHKKECNTKKSATWKDYYTRKCNMEMVQYEETATWKNINFLREIWKKCTRIVHYSAQTDNGPSVDGPLYTDVSEKISKVIANSWSSKIILSLFTRLILQDCENFSLKTSFIVCQKLLLSLICTSIFYS